MTTRPTIAVDLDGTLAEYEGWLGEEVIGPPIPGALAFLEDLHSAEAEIVIFSARAGTKPGSDAIWRWLTENKVDQIVTEVTNIKHYRFAAMVDDRALGFRRSEGYEKILISLGKGILGGRVPRSAASGG
jgi:hypothetical protein